MLPLSDRNAWYYPSLGHDSDEEDLSVGHPEGNWGHKNTKKCSLGPPEAKSTPGVRKWRTGRYVLFLRSQKAVVIGPQAEERARKRIKLLLPQERRSPSPPTLPHLARTPSPPLVSPYPAPNPHHTSYASFVLDKSITHTFRSSLLDELEHATNGLIEGEATVKRALGRLWQVMSEDPDMKTGEAPMVPKREDADDEPDELDDQARRLARAPDLTPAAHKLFLLSYPSEAPSNHDPSHFTVPETQFNTLEKNLATLRELKDDGREYVERLQEIREGLGDARAQRNVIWNMVRERAVRELQEAAIAHAAAQ